MSLGDQWTGWMGKAVDQAKGEELLDFYYNAGGNFIDTSNNYQGTFVVAWSVHELMLR
jgi:aryl-alcohol dehydrogenase-like predicted oxidoreductase